MGLANGLVLFGHKKAEEVSLSSSFCIDLNGYIFSQQL